MEASSSSSYPRYIDNGCIELVSVIGTGAYGVVHLGVDSRYGQPTYRAIKCLRRHGLDARQRHFQRREIGLHRLASSHSSIVTMDRLVEEGDHIYVVMDYGENGDLFAMITDQQRYVGDDELIRSIFLQLLDGVAHLHDLSIAHRDLKPENVVCSNDGQTVKICDFGLATSESTSSEFGCGSTFYIAPECLGDWYPEKTSYPTRPGDVWSLGVILVNLVCGRNPWRIASPSDESFNAFLNDPNFLRRILPISVPCLNILTTIFTLNPAERIPLAKLRKLVVNCPTFSMNEEELRLAHAAAASNKSQHSYSTESVEDEDLIDIDEEGVIRIDTEELDDEDWREGEDEAMFGYDHELASEETPSLSTDSGSPSPPAVRSRSGSFLGTSLPPTPLLGAESVPPLDALVEASKVEGAVWDLYNHARDESITRKLYTRRPSQPLITSPEIITVGVPTGPYFRS